MAQFSVHENGNPDSRGRYPLLLDVQSPLLDSLETRLVVPLVPLSAFKGQPIATLTPILEVGQDAHVMLTPQMAGVSRRVIGKVVADLTGQRDQIIAAIDLLITGI